MSPAVTGAGQVLSPWVSAVPFVESWRKGQAAHWHVMKKP